ncbi:MAG: ABC-F family ATP-binding cassette domain-containing protein [Clostridia bacterium]|nr:ABC-F family ATP-binding cassette domain-containing protein [Clostridia bacterium]
MSLLEITSVTKSYGAELILDGVTLSVANRDRIGFVGPNGSGKTTLLRIIAGLDDCDSGLVSLASNRAIGYLPQGKEYTSGNTLYQEMLLAFGGAASAAREMRELEQRMGDPTVMASESALADVMRRYSEISAEHERLGGYDHDVRIKTTLFGLGFREEDLSRVIDTLSGGQKVRVALARMLVSDPDLLLLDEPTNHLDMDACEWLEAYLKSFRGAFIVVSHDRYFLDAAIERTWDLDGLRIVDYPGNYTFFMNAKALAREQQAEEYSRQQEQIQKLEDYIRRYKAGNRATMAQSREKMLARIQRIQKPTDGPSMKAAFGKAVRSGRLAVVAARLSKSFGQRKLFSDVELAIERGERLGVVGPNGSGKTTFLRIIAGDLDPDTGSVALGENVVPGVFWQDLGGLDDNSTVLQELHRMRDWTLGEARSYLARFLFRGEDVFKQIRVLSGGERNRLILAKLILSAPNLMLLDEPTNHLDIPSRHGLEQALAEYDGTVICASHDRYFLDQVATAILEIADGRARLYQGNYSFYRERKSSEAAAGAAGAVGAAGASAARAAESAEAGGTSGSGAHGPGQPRRGDRRSLAAGTERRSKRSRGPVMNPAEAEAARIEQEIEDTEACLAEVEASLASGELYADGGERAREAVLEQRRIQGKLEVLYEAWEKALAEIDTIGGRTE